MGCAKDFVDECKKVFELQVVKSLGLRFANIGFDVRGIGTGEQYDSGGVATQGVVQQEGDDYVGVGQISANLVRTFACGLRESFDRVAQQGGWLEDAVGDQQALLAMREFSQVPILRIVIELNGFEGGCKAAGVGFELGEGRGDSEMANRAPNDLLLQSVEKGFASGVGEGGLVQEKNIDVVSLQGAQAGFETLDGGVGGKSARLHHGGAVALSAAQQRGEGTEKAFGRSDEAGISGQTGGHLETELGGDGNTIATSAQELGENAFGAAETVGSGDIEVSDAERKSALENGHSF